MHSDMQAMGDEPAERLCRVHEEATVRQGRAKPKLLFEKNQRGSNRPASHYNAQFS